MMPINTGRCYSLPQRNNCILKAEITNSSTLEDIYLNFTNNYSFDNDTKFGGDLEHCEVQVNDKYLQLNGFQFLKCVNLHAGWYQRKYLLPSYESVLLQNGTPDCYGESSKHISIVPGRLFNVSLVIVGVLDIPVHSILTTVTADGFLPGLAEVHIQNPRLCATCTNVGFKIYTEDDGGILLYPNLCFGTDVTLYFSPDPCQGASFSRRHNASADKNSQL